MNQVLNFVILLLPISSQLMVVPFSFRSFDFILQGISKVLGDLRLIRIDVFYILLKVITQNFFNLQNYL